MIPPELIKKIKTIHITSRETVNTLMAGKYRSVFRGSGMEFEEVREYSPGDEVKSIDWKVSARLGKPYVKLYREERQSIVMLLMDISGSLSFGSFHGKVLEKAAEIASVLAFNAIKNNDKVGVIFFTDRVEKYIPPQKGSAHVWRVIKEIFTIQPQGRNTDLGSALEYLAKVMKKRCFAFIISDFLDTGYETALKTSCRRHELIGIRMTDPGACCLPQGGIIGLTDPETGRRIMVNAWDKKTQDRFANQALALKNHTATVFSRARTDLIHMDTRDNTAQVLTAYFRQREKRFR